jgi:tetratricopeptide (TPR) repeat protein
VITSTGNPLDVFSSDEEAEQCLETLTSFDAIELHYNNLLAYYKSKEDGFRYARAALAALHACNHLGYYYEASSFIEAILPHFDRLVGGSEDNRWNYSGNLYHSLIVQGAVKEARQIIEHMAKPFLTQKSLRARMEYILGIIDLRHSTPPDLSAAEEHFISAVDLIRASREELEPHEYAFLKVFIENGLAFLRARQGRREEAIQLCQAGYELLTRELGPEKHKLHRSVLQYNTAQVYSMMGELEVALAHYANAIQMDPNYSEYYNEVGNIYQRQGRFDEALKFYETAMKLSAPYPEVCFNRGVCLAREEKWQTAFESCEYSLALSWAKSPCCWLRNLVAGPVSIALNFFIADTLESVGPQSAVNRNFALFAPGQSTSRLMRPRPSFGECVRGSKNGPCAGEHGRNLPSLNPKGPSDSSLRRCLCSPSFGIKMSMVKSAKAVGAA